MGGLVAESVTTKALRAILKPSNGVIAIRAQPGTVLYGVGIALIAQVGEGLWNLVRPATPIGHISCVGLVVYKGRRCVQRWIWVRVVPSLLTGIAKIEGSVAIAVEVVREQPSLARIRCHDSAGIVPGIDKVHSITITTGRIRT